MSLATRCTACGTVFRVVQDQLKVSEGWVRCGRCNEVFNAMEALFDLDRDAQAEPAQATRSAPLDEVPAPAIPAQAPLAASFLAEQAQGASAAPVDLDVGHAGASDPLFEPFDARLASAPPMPGPAAGVEPPVPSFHPEPEGRPRETHRSTPATRVDERDRLEFPDARFDSELLVGEDSSQALDDEVEEAPAPEPLAPLDTEANEPHFVLHAVRRARWQTPRMIALQAGVLALLVVLFGLQCAIHFRDQLAARWPSTAPAFAAWCAMASCALEAPRRIDDLVVENTALVRVPLPDAFKVSVVLRNRGSLAVMAPSVDLTLTDAAGLPVVRRMLSPHDFLAPGGPLKPGLEAPWQLVVVTPAADRVTGYTVEVFYP